MSYLKQLIAACVAALVLFVCFILAIWALDIYTHAKFDKNGTLNRAGYRGEIEDAKQADEYRIGIFGGSVAFGYGESNEYSIASQLEERLQGINPNYNVINLANTGEYSITRFKSNYRLFEYLDLDSVLFFVFYDYGMDDLEVQPFAEDVGASTRDKLKQIFPDSVALNKEGSFADVLNQFISDSSHIRPSDYHLLERVRARTGSSNDSPVRDGELAVLKRWILHEEMPDVIAGMPEIIQEKRSFRGNNWVFQKMGYWSVLPSVLWEKYYLIFYDSIENGYKNDKLRPALENILGTKRALSNKPEAAPSLYEFVDELGEKGKRVIFAFIPVQGKPDSSDISRTYMGLKYFNMSHVEFIGPGDMFGSDRAADYFVDDVHMSKAGNAAVASAIFRHFKENER